MDSSILVPVLIAVGAVPGALSRYYLTLICTHKFGDRVPYGTLFINLSGAFLIGFFSTLFQGIGASPRLSILVSAGFLGSYTTFSTYQLDTFNLIKIGNYKNALLYWIGSPILGFLCVEIGILLARRLLS